MASLTKKTNSIRRRKHAKMGAARKKALAAKGTTPAFAIHKEPAAPAKAKKEPAAPAKAKKEPAAPAKAKAKKKTAKK